MQQIANTESDAAIVQQIIDGDRNAFETLMKRYEQPVLGILKRHLPYSQIEETAQDVFVRAYQSLPASSRPAASSTGSPPSPSGPATISGENITETGKCP
jgi:RNA polymerase sigma-70 factor (ECF subfamily)